MPKLVGVNDAGRRVGEDHPCAVLTDHDVEMIFQLREEGMGYRRIARLMECSKSLVRRIVKGEVRAQRATRHKRVP